MKSTVKIKRLTKIAKVLTKYGFEDVVGNSKLSGLFSRKDSKQANNSTETVYEKIRKILEELGPTYVKFGQIFSDRDDILPKELTQELKKLQDNVKPVNIDVKNRLEEELGINPDEHFSEIDDNVLASASISQVYRAKLISGEDVILKVKRPDIQNIIESDLLVIKDFVEIIQHHKSLKDIEFQKMIKVFENSMTNELSMINELENIRIFSDKFSDNKVAYVHKAYDRYSNNNILCLEFIDGFKVSSTDKIIANGFDPILIAKQGLDLYMQQVLVHGFFHADPHPGNILITKEGKIAFIDFGAMGRLMPSDMEKIEDFIQNAVQKNAKGLISTIKSIAIDFQIDNEKNLERDIYELLDLFESSGLKKLNITEIANKAQAIFNKNKIKLPEYLFLLMKGIAQIEGIGRKLDPNLNVFDVMKPYGRAILKKRLSLSYIFSKGIDTLKGGVDDLDTLRNLLTKVSNGELKIQHEIVEKKWLERLIENLSYAIIIASLFIGSAILVLANIPPKIFGIPALGLLGFLIAGFLALSIGIKILRKK